MGAAPVPSATIVLILTAYQTAFGSSVDAGEIPDGLGYIIASKCKISTDSAIHPQSKLKIICTQWTGLLTDVLR